MAEARGLEIRDLSAGYGHDAIVRGVSLEVGSGEIVGIIGGNGQGKSTLLQAIVGLIRARGQVTLDGRSLSGLPPHAINRLGVSYVPQTTKVFPSLTVRENLLLATDRRPELWRDRFGPALAEFPEIGELLEARAGNLSGGQQQFVAIARALVQRPRLLILDEPAAGLARALVTRLAGVLRRLASDQVAVMMVEHETCLLNDVATRGYALRGGRIVGVGTWSPELIGASTGSVSGPGGPYVQE